MVDRSLSSPAVVDRPTSLQLRNRETARLTSTLDSGQIVAELRAKISSGQLGCDSIQQIVDVAWTVTGAHGAAIAMRQNRSVLCTARAGKMAPDLGSELSPDSGISGECLRTGGALRCDDTMTDTRVDAEACRRLGLRSLAVAPVGKRPAVSGILEAFSPNPGAFNDTHLQLLVELAELVMAAQRTRTQLAVLRTRLKLAGATRNWKLILPAAVVLAFVGWLVFRGKAPRSNFSEALPQPVSVAVAPVAADQQFRDVAKPSPALGISARRVRAGLPPGVVMARTTETTRSKPVIKSKPQPEAASDASAGTGPGGNLTPAAGRGPVDEGAPALEVASGGDNPVIAGILSPSSALPAVRISQGLSGGTIDRRVNPVYPTQALRMRLEGRVVLQAVVTKEGAVRDVKVIDGNQVLARAALDAVRRWHFQPYRLNGEPIQMTTDITLIFKLP